MAKLHFDIRDIFRVIRLGWSGKKIWVGLIGLAISYVGYSVLVLIAHSVSGTALSDVWRQYALFPSAQLGTLTPLGTVIHVLGMVFVVAVVLLASCMVCKITYQQLRGDDFYSSGDAWKFLKSNWTGVLLGPVALLAMLAFFVVTGIIIGWLAGIIPVAGELLFAVSFIPIFFSALVAVFGAIALVVALAMAPAIVGTMGEDTLEVVIQAFSLTWSQPWRLALYVLWMNVSVGIGVAVLGALMGGSLWLVSQFCGMFMGQKLANMLQVAHYYVPCASDWSCIEGNLPLPGDPSGAEIWSGRILSVMMILLMGIFLSYCLAAKASGMSLIYVILRKRKDDENLLEWKDETLDDDMPAIPEPKKDEETTDKASEGAEEKGEEAAKTSEEGAKDDGDESETKPDDSN